MKENETVMSIQTMKNAVEIRAPFSGIIKNHFFKIGDNVNCNTELFEIEQNDTVVNSKQQVNKESVSDNNTKEKQKNESDKNKSNFIDTSNNINNNIFEPKVDSSIVTKSSNNHNTSSKNILFSNNSSERMIISEPMSSLRHLINEKMKFIQNEKAVLSTFNEVSVIY